jgi:hypothetical protein
MTVEMKLSKFSPNFQEILQAMMPVGWTMSHGKKQLCRKVTTKGIISTTLSSVLASGDCIQDEEFG